ncbi:RDD family protein [Neolewinella aurantiaca]|uniref:RDD family protein n=1 Tax=Neolewinella aurantiaca TaxID=2602767 RepID=A0A5C7FJF9_9BACT|nr:RDD family protein [Neolewinella aurantiaca]TXF91396.1 RDD family protein [Neolewinella aurantiaca]
MSSDIKRKKQPKTLTAMEFDDLLDDNLSTESRYAALADASKGKRFWNYLIDQTCMMVIGFLAGIAIALADPYGNETWLLNSGAIGNYLFGAFIALVYYPLTEGLLGGKSIGKLLTGTRAVRQDGTKVDMQDVFLRTLSRVVPFEAWSFLGSKDRGWHDEWTKTKVVDEKHRHQSKGVY